MTELLKSLPLAIRDELKPLIERAALPFHPSLDRVVVDFYGVLARFGHLGASLANLAQLLSEVGVTTREGRPVTASTLSKSLARARARETTSPSETTSTENATDDRYAGRLATLAGTPRDAATGHARQIADQGGRPACAAIDHDSERQKTAAHGAKRRATLSGGSARHPTANHGGMRPLATLSDNSRPSTAKNVALHEMPTLENGLRQKAAAGGAPPNACERYGATPQQGIGKKSRKSKGAVRSLDSEIGSDATVKLEQPGAAITETFAATLRAGNLVRKIRGEPSDQEE